jgi:hypothetical protein
MTNNVANSNNKIKGVCLTCSTLHHVKMTKSNNFFIEKQQLLVFFKKVIHLIWNAQVPI